MIKRNGILAAGNWIVDRIKMIDTYPQQDALANILTESTGNGGAPYNVLIDLAKLGAGFPLEALGLIGDDQAGVGVLTHCAEHHIDTKRLITTPLAPTSYTDVMTVKSTGRRTFFHQRGANAFLDASHFDFENSNARIFHLGYLLLLDRLDEPHAQAGTVAAHVLQRARAAGLTTSIDVVSEDSDRFAKVVLPALNHCDYCIVNEFEAQQSTGVKLCSPAGVQWGALEEAAKKLMHHGVREWVVIHFPEGAFGLSATGETLRQGSVRLPQDQIAGTVGAGDAFAAGILLGLHNKIPMADCLRDGVAAAATCLLHSSTSGGIRPIDECRAMGNRLGYRETHR